MIRLATRDPSRTAPVPFERPERPAGAVGPPNPTHSRQDGGRPPRAEWKPCPSNLSRAELRCIVIDILG